MVKSEFTAEDIPEELLGYVDGYIKTVIKNTKKRFYKQKTRYKKYGLVFVELDKYAENLRYEDPGFERTLHQEIDVAGAKIAIFNPELADALRGLTEAQRVVLLKNAFLNVPIKQIASELGISCRMVEKHKHNAIQAIKRSMSINDKE